MGALDPLGLGQGWFPSISVDSPRFSHPYMLTNNAHFRVNSRANRRRCRRHMLGCLCRVVETLFRSIREGARSTTQYHHRHHRHAVTLNFWLVCHWTFTLCRRREVVFFWWIVKFIGKGRKSLKRSSFFSSLSAFIKPDYIYFFPPSNVEEEIVPPSRRMHARICVALCFTLGTGLIVEKILF